MIRMFGFWRSAAAFRVRMALNLKSIAYTEDMVDLDAGEQYAAEYTQLNPQAKLPLVILEDGARLTQSIAILEYIEEAHPEPPLLPPDPLGRARVRALALIWAADHHPLITPRIRTYLRDSLGVGEEARTEWLRHWFAEGLRAGEAELAGEAGQFCHGDALSIADLCLMSQVMGARGYKVDFTPFPTINRIVESCLAIDAIARAVPLRQVGAPASH